MNGYTSIIASDKILRLGVLTSILLIVLTFIYLGIFYRSLPPLLPLYNQMPWGEARLGNTLEVFMLPGIALAIFFINTFFATRLYAQMPLISRALIVTSFLITLITVIFIFRTVQMLL